MLILMTFAKKAGLKLNALSRIPPWTLTKNSYSWMRSSCLNSIIVLWSGCVKITQIIIKYRSSRPEVFLRKGALKIYSKFSGEHPCRSVISIKLHSNFIEIALRHGCSPANLLHIFTTPFLKNTSGWLLLEINRRHEKCLRLIYNGKRSSFWESLR